MNKRFHTFLAAILLVCLCAFPLVGISGVKADGGWVPPVLQPQLSADGNALLNGTPPLVVVVDPDAAHQNIQAPRDPEIQAAIDGAATDPSAVNAAFSIDYKANGTYDPWGAPCSTFPAAAKTAFAAAAAIWTATIQSSVPITIQACWSNMGSPVILGYSGGANSYRNFSGAPKSNVWYESTLADALHGSNLKSAGEFDDYITYNSGFSWYYGTNGVVPGGEYDLVTVAAHEMCHGLNFSGTAGYSSGTGSYGGGTIYPNIFDTFMENSGGTKLTSYTNPSTALGTLFTSNSLWFNGTNSKAANGGTRVKMYAPSSWSGGSSYSHLDYSTFAGTSNSMMVYAVSSGASQHNPGAVTKGILKDMGWTMASSGPVTVPTPISPSGTISNTKPTFTWSKVTSATKYQFAVYNGSTLAYPVKVVLSSACGSSTTNCSNTPTTALSYAAHTWKVQAYVGGVWKSYSALKSFTITNIPTPIAPSGTITATKPTFTWSRITGATQYNFILYKGSSTVYNKTVASSTCGSSTTNCSNTPTTALSVAAYTWKVRAYVGAWKAFSSTKAFTVAAPTTGFDSEFTSDASGWTPLNGAWNVASGSYQTPGINTYFVSSKHSGTYNILTYTVNVKMTGCTGCAYGLEFNGTPSPIANSGRWNKGYGFFVATGYYEICRYDASVATCLVPWTASSYVTGSWNTLQVTYNYTTHFVKFYINGHLMVTGSFTTYTSGQVGLAMYYATTPSRLYVDYAKLSLSAPTAIVAGDSLSADGSLFVDESTVKGITGANEMVAP